MIGIRKRYHRPGTSPGTLQAPIVQRVEKVAISVINYSADHFEERAVATLEDCFSYRDSPTVSWINITGLHDLDLLQTLGNHFGIHPLSLEDVLNTGQRPKLEEYENYYFIVARMPHHESELVVEQVSLFLFRNYVITLQEIEADVFEPVRNRLRKGSTRIRTMGSDYLAYALIDGLVDSLFPILEAYGERIEALEDALIEDPTAELLEEIHLIKRDLLTLRRIIWPEREVINKLQREELDLIHPETKLFLRDCYDHTVQIVDIIETYRELGSALMDFYLSSVGNRMNEIMKVLTIIATIFIPLTFIVGVYGMNFNPDASPWSMPELNWYWGYPATLLVMLVLGLLMLIYFRRKGWLG